MRHGTWIAVVALTCGAGTARAQGMDYPSFHGRESISPVIGCLMWAAPGSTGFSSADQANINGYLSGLTSYLSNQLAPQGVIVGGIEPTLRQYNVWGAYFPTPCVQDSSAQTDLNPDVIDEVTYAQQNLGLPPDSDTTIQVAFVKGSHYMGTIPCVTKTVTNAGGLLVIVYPDMCTIDPRLAAAQQIFDLAANPWGAGWYTEEVLSQIKGQCSAIANRNVSDDGAVEFMPFPAPPPDGFNQVYTVDDDIDLTTGNYDNCGTTRNGTLFTSAATTPAVAVVQRRGKTTYLDAIARTPTGLVHLVSTNGGVSFQQVSPAPAGVVTELPTVFSPDGHTLEMYGRGTDGALYHWTYNGTSWSSPNWLGGYLIGPPSAAFASVNGVRTNAVVMLATNGQIAAVMNGNWSWVSMPPAMLSVTPPQLVARNSSCLDLTFVGQDGNTYLNPCWTGTWQTIPGVYGLVSQVSRGVRTDIFGRPPIGPGGATPYWLEYNSGSLTRSGSLSQLPIGAGTIAAVGVGTLQVTKLFYSSNARIYATTSDATGTAFNNSVQLDPLSVTNPPTAFSPDNTAIVLFDRRRSDGHLVEWRFDGTNWTAATDLGVAVM